MANKKRVLVLVDGDMVAFSHAAAEEYGKELEDVNFAKIQMSMDSKMKFILDRLGATDYFTTMSGSENMRDAITDDYKANREGVWRPHNLKNAKAHLLVAWNGIAKEGLEADDLMAMLARHEYELVMGKRNQIKEMIYVGPNTYDEVYIVSLDKDLRQVGRIGGKGPVIKHYQWERESQGIGEKIIPVEDFGELKVIVKPSGKSQKKEVKGHGPKFFLWQLLTGDSTDGVIGCGKQVQAMYKSGAKAGQSYSKREGVGAIEAYETLKDCTSYAQGLEMVKRQYVLHFADGWQKALLKAGRLMYMAHMVDDGHLVRLWHFDGKTTDRYDLKEKRVVSHAEYLQR